MYVVDADKKAHIRVVTLKTTQENDVSVGPELKPGELVVVEGTDKVQEGARVDLQTPVAPASLQDKTAEADVVRLAEAANVVAAARGPGNEYLGALHPSGRSQHLC